MYDQWEQKLSVQRVGCMAERETQNSTNYYYNHSGAREQEEFLLEYKFLHLLMPKGKIAKLLTMCRSFLLAV